MRIRNRFIILLLLAVVLVFSTACTRGFDSWHFRGELASESIEGKLAIASPKAGDHVSREAVVEGGCVENFEVSLEGSLDQEVVFPCEKGTFSVNVTLSGADGVVQLQARQKQLNQDYVVATSFIKDSVAPEVMISTPEDQKSFRTSIVTSGFCEDGMDSTLEVEENVFDIKCENSLFAATIPLQELLDGIYTLIITQIDRAGNRSRRSRRIEKDTTPPVLTVTTPARNSEVNAMFDMTGTCEGNLEVVFSGDIKNSGGTTNCSNGRYTMEILLSDSEGSKTIGLSHSDKAGNTTTLSHTVVYKMPDNNNGGGGDPPSVQITSPSNNDFINKDSFQLEGRCTSGVAVKISGSGHQSPAQTNCNSGTFRVTVQTTAGDGTKTINVSQANNYGMDSDSRSVIKDTKAPALAIISPKSGEFSNGSLEVLGSCEDNLAVTLSGEFSGAPRQLVCSSGTFRTQVTLNTGEGNRSVMAAQTDAAGNSSTASVSVSVDTNGPAVSFTSPQNGSTFEAANVAVTGTCETGLPVVLGGTGLLSAQQVNCTSEAFSASVLLSDGEGTKAMYAKQTDSAGNTGQANLSVVRKIVIPTLDGVQLYANNCAACHGSVDNSAKRGRNAEQIRSAILNVNQMNHLSSLKSEEVFAIAVALGGELPPTDPSDPSDPTDPSDPNPTPGEKVNPYTCTDPEATSVTRIRRLTKPEYKRSLMDILAGHITESELDSVLRLIPEEQIDSLDVYFDSWSQAISGGHINSYHDVAFSLADRLTKSQSWRTQVMDSGCGSNTNFYQGCLNLMLSKFGRSVFRRPLSTEEANIFKNKLTEIGTSNHDGMIVIVAALLQSPRFLYRVEEVDQPIGGNTYQLDGYEVAQRLAYTLWGTTPNQELLDAASSGAILSQYEQWVDYMLAHPKAKDNFKNFTGQWMGISQLPEAKHPDWYAQGLNTETLASDISNDFTSFVNHIVWQRGGKYSDLMTSQEGIINTPNMSAIYQPGGAATTTGLPLVLSPDSQQGTVNVSGVSLPSGATTVYLTMNVLDPDNADEAELRINSNGAIQLFGSFADNAHNNQTRSYTLSTPASQWRNGSNTLVFRHLRSNGSTIQSLSVSYSQSAQQGLVDLGPTRKGILTRPAIAYNSTENISIVHRGLVIRNAVLCQTIDEPDPEALPDGALDLPPADESMSSRQIIESKTSVASCTGCHSTINPMGFVMQNYDALGRYVEVEKVFDDNGNIIATHNLDTSAHPNIDAFNEPKVNNASEMSEAIANSVAGPKCMTQRWFEFAHGRAPAAEDSCQLNNDFENVENVSIQDMIKGHVMSPAFRKKGD